MQSHPIVSSLSSMVEMVTDMDMVTSSSPMFSGAGRADVRMDAMISSLSVQKATKEKIRKK